MMWGFALWALATSCCRPSPRTLVLCGRDRFPRAGRRAPAGPQEGRADGRRPGRRGQAQTSYWPRSARWPRQGLVLWLGDDWRCGSQRPGRTSRCRGADWPWRASARLALGRDLARASSTPALLWRSALSTVSTMCGALSPASSYCFVGCVVVLEHVGQAHGAHLEAGVESALRRSPGSGRARRGRRSLPSSIVTTTSCVAHQPADQRRRRAAWRSAGRRRWSTGPWPRAGRPP